jgi:hypothetical protein
MPIDEVGERVQRDVLRERHRQRKLAVVDGEPPADAVVDQAEERAVDRVQHEPDRAPRRPAGHRLAEDRDVRVVGAKEPLVERLERRPDRGRSGAGRSRMETTFRHNRKRARR